MVSGVAGRFLPLIPDLGVMMTPGATYFLLAGLARNPGGLPLEARRPDTADACACPMGRWTGGDQPILRGRSEALIGRDVGDVGQPDPGLRRGRLWSGLSAVKLRASRFGATGRLWWLSVVRGVRRRPRRAESPHLAHQPRDAPARMPQPFP